MVFRALGTSVARSVDRATFCPITAVSDPGMTMRIDGWSAAGDLLRVPCDSALRDRRAALTDVPLLSRACRRDERPDGTARPASLRQRDQRLVFLV
jgi:hypothetical protein